MTVNQGVTGASVLQYNEALTVPRHYKKENTGARHLKKENNRPKILKGILSLELVLVMLSCCCIYSLSCRNLEVREFREACTSALLDMTDQAYAMTDSIMTSTMESINEEVDEYVWTTDEVTYREGADTSYKSAGTLDGNEMIKRTGITYNGWCRISVDDEDYYVPEDSLSADIPESLPIAPGVKGEYQKYALSLFPDFGWSSSELEPLIYLWNRESGWNPSSHNKSSGAHGIPQALPASKMASEGSDYYTNAEPQIRWGLKYIAGRYGSPSSAWAHFCSSGWY